MDDNEEIAAKIKDGSYYRDALDWYMRRYLFPITERTFLILISAVMAILFILSVLNIKSLIGENEKVAFPIKVENSTDYLSIIRSLASKSEPTQNAIAKYLTIHYITAREEYSYNETKGKTLKYKLKNIKSSSSKSVLNEYKSYMNEINPYSPIIRYRTHTRRMINITSLKFDNNDPTSGKAKVAFEAVTKNRITNKKEKTFWEATVHFRLPDIETIARTGAPLRYLVKYYKVQLLTKE